MPTDCEGCDCACIAAKILYYQAEVTVAQAEQSLANAAYSAAQTGYYFYLYQQYMCGCGSGMMASPEGKPDPACPITSEMMKSLAKSAELTFESMKALVDQNNGLRDQIAALTPPGK